MKQLPYSRHSAGHWWTKDKRDKKSRLQNPQSRQCQCLILLEKAKSYFSFLLCLLQQLFFPISFAVTCCSSLTILCLNNWNHCLMTYFFTLLYSPWLIFNLASWSMQFVVTPLIFLKCDCNLFPSKSKAISNTPTFYIHYIPSPFQHCFCYSSWTLPSFQTDLIHQCLNMPCVFPFMLFCYQWSSHLASFSLI